MKRDLRQFTWRHPEWWVVALAVLSWGVLLPHGGHPMGFGGELGHWMLMVGAMMLPFLVEQVRVAAEASLWARRHRAIGLFLTGYLAPWLAVGVFAAWLRGQAWTRGEGAPAAFFALGVLWIAMPLRTRALAECHRRVPLAPVGWRADRDCLRYGVTVGLPCVASCWPLMFACAFTGHSTVAMAGGFLVGALERWPYRPRQRAAMEATAAFALYYLVLALLPQGRVFAEPAGVVAASQGAFPLAGGPAQVALLPPKGETLAHLAHRAPGRRFYLGIENITSERGAPEYAVFLNLPEGEAGKHRDRFAGQMPMFGLREASRGKAGLTYRFDVTDLIRRLAAGADWDAALIRVTFVPEREDHEARVRVGQAVLVESAP